MTPIHLKALRFVTSLGLALGLLTGAAMAQPGVSVGLNFNKLSEIQSDTGPINFDGSAGWHIEAWYVFNTPFIGIRPGVRYMRAGKIYDGLNTSTITDATLDMFEIPVDLRVKIGTPLVSPFVTAGPVLRIPTGYDGAISGIRSLVFAGSVGIGANIGLGGLSIIPELKVVFNLSSLTGKDYEIGGITFSADEEQKLTSVLLRLGVPL